MKSKKRSKKVRFLSQHSKMDPIQIVAVIVVAIVIWVLVQKISNNISSTSDAISDNANPPLAATEEPIAINESTHKIYAGFTDNQAMPFIMIHQSGENLVMMGDINSSNITGIVWNSVDGNSIVIYSDSNGRPAVAIVGRDIIYYSNYTNDTVDLTVIQADGTRSSFQSKLDTNLLNKITSFVPASDSLVSYSIPDTRNQEQLDKWFWMKTGMYMYGAATCTAGGYVAITTGAVLLPPVILKLAESCSGTILGTLTRVGTIFDMDVGGLESINSGLNMVNCASAKLTACVNVFLTEAEKQEKLAKQRIANSPPTPTFTPPPTKRPIPTNTPKPVSSVRGMLCGRYTILIYIDPSGTTSEDFIFVTSDNTLGLWDSFGEYGGYYRIYDAVIDWTSSETGHGTPVDGWITSWSGYEPISSLNNCSQKLIQPPALPSTGTKAQISNEVYFAALRQSPGYSNKNNEVDLLADIPAGDIVQILGGPEEADGLNWWYVSWNGLTGWMADHTSSGKTILIFLP